MTERKDRYRAALERGRDSAARPAKVTTLHTRYVSVTIEVDPDLQKGLTRWAGSPLSMLVLAGTTVLRTVSDVAPSVPFFPGGARRS
ncbi:hypothetical protein [Streptomyces sp. AM8-1-1]|uniref:hypothetical protein n=1 Tax=Streptomyces sp. AM8-1-1 TaxID=3075825 RepID=UPI0028C4A060|nr:hypothetical protein [Streptomyces sp. AM8-1-1]WNO76732.1 hypothetical protein RPQ07_36150 [Streptomyces sp. AM8-1-1]